MRVYMFLICVRVEGHETWTHIIFDAARAAKVSRASQGILELVTQFDVKAIW